MTLSVTMLVMMVVVVTTREKVPSRVTAKPALIVVNVDHEDWVVLRHSKGLFVAR